MTKAPSYNDAVKRIQLPDGSIAEYPDSMSDEAISQDLSKQFPAPQQNENNNLSNNMQPNSGQKPRIVKTFFGPLPNPNDYNMLQDKELINEMINAAAGTPGIKIAGQGIAKAANYLRPQKTADIFMKEVGQGKTSEENIAELAKRLAFGRSSAAEEALQHKKPIFTALGEESIINPGNVYVTGKKYSGKYLSNANPAEYGSDLKELHKEFALRPTLNNADALQQQIGSRIGDLRKLQYLGKGDQAIDQELASLYKARQNLLADQDLFMSNQSPYVKAQYDLFRNKWRKNVTPYDESPLLSEIVRKGKTEGITPGEIKNIFANPSGEIKKIISDIGPSGKKNVLYNELQASDKLNAKELANKLKEAKQFGYQEYISPEMEMLANELATRYNITELTKTLGRGALGAVGGSVVGNPLLGAAIGLGWNVGKNVGKETLKKFKK